MKKQILLVDDDQDILELLEYNLLNDGYDVIGMLNTKHVRDILSEEQIDLIIMDRGLPDIEGSFYIEMLRSKNINTPVIFLSAKNSQEEIKEGFIKGADDYVVKPFDIEELKLRINAVLKRQNSQTKENIENIEYKDIQLDLNIQKALIAGVEISLTKLETALLKLMILNKGKVLDREFLLKNIWNESESTNKKTVNVAIKRLKEKIDPLGEKNYIKTIRGIGYMIN
ncbi:response regulator transcription factor [Sulfurimonas microaerophilic]|uniref:response regulator transcription factor n=1 Tax=Sulfurimonas microaerophilic TaxID=3058392 RepID=UPI002714A4B9|nr:response regulator transcription factor [Sulfurimonas sp. hsl 1-7]